MRYRHFAAFCAFAVMCFGLPNPILTAEVWDTVAPVIELEDTIELDNAAPTDSSSTAPDETNLPPVVRGKPAWAKPAASKKYSRATAGRRSFEPRGKHSKSPDLSQTQNIDNGIELNRQRYQTASRKSKPLNRPSIPTPAPRDTASTRSPPAFASELHPVSFAPQERSSEPLPGPQSDIPQPAIRQSTETPKPVSTESFKPIGQITATIPKPTGELPVNSAVDYFAQAGIESHMMGISRFDVGTEFNWEATALCHQPLYFEEVNLERHGYRIPLVQPLISGAHFFSKVPAVPYLVVSQKQRECTYTLGHYRPGSPAPYLWYYPRFSLDGAAVEAVLITGLMYAIP